MAISVRYFVARIALCPIYVLDPPARTYLLEVPEAEHGCQLGKMLQFGIPRKKIAKGLIALEVGAGRKNIT